MVVFDKPAGVLVIPAPGYQKRSLIEIVNEEFPDPLKRRLYPCHRLDRETSGCIVFAKGKKNQQLMMAEFRKREVHKIYLAFVRGCPSRTSGELRGPVRDIHERTFRPSGAPRQAVLSFRVLEKRRSFSVVEVHPQTGRTNQIRIQFQQIGCPLLGERVYARGKDFKIKFRRLALHAQELAFRQPVTNRSVRVTSELPLDMRDFLTKNP